MNGDPLRPRDPSARRETCALRMERHGPGLVAAFERLYGNDASAQSARLLAVIDRAAAERPDWLAARDMAHEQAPDWHLASDRLGYSGYVDRFAGTLAGMEGRIAYLREIGVTYLHLLPFWRRREGENDGGFAISDYRMVEPSLGTNGDLVHLCRALAAAEITLCADLVLNHTADDHAWAVAAKGGDERCRHFYHVFPDRVLPDQYETTLAEVFPDTAPGNFTFVPELGWVWTTFYPYQWDLNWHNPDVFVALVEIMLDLANFGIGAFRLDSAPFLWKRQGTNGQNQPETHTILRMLRQVLSIAAPGVLLKAEAVVPARELPAYFGLPDDPGGECQIAYQSSLMAASWAAVARADADLLRRVVSDTPPLGKAGGWLTYVRCHDDIGWGVLRQECTALGDVAGVRIEEAAGFLGGLTGGSFARGRAFQSGGLVATNGMAASLVGIEAGLAVGDAALIDAGINRILLLYALAFSVGGMPVLYMGDEIGQTNSTGPCPENDGRWLHRPDFDEAAAGQRHDTSSVPGRIFAGITRLAARRFACPALAADAPLRLLPFGNTALLAFARGDRFVGLFNFSDVAFPISAWLGEPDAAWRDLVADAPLGSQDALPAWSFRWLIR